MFNSYLQVSAMPRVLTQTGDVIGFTSLGHESGVVYVRDPAPGPVIAVVEYPPGEGPVEGGIYSPTGHIPQYRFSLAVDISPSKYSSSYRFILLPIVPKFKQVAQIILK